MSRSNVDVLMEKKHSSLTLWKTKISLLLISATVCTDLTRAHISEVKVILLRLELM